MALGCVYGTHRVLEPKGVLPQPAWRVDNETAPYDNEILVDVETLNVDSASFHQISESTGGDPIMITEHILDIVARRGKMHNPVTGSGGMLIGTVRWVGPAIKADVKPGDRIATLVSLSLTPLRLQSIRAVRPETDQIDVEGTAILFESGIFAKMPPDIPDTLALAVLDVAGAPAQANRLVKPGNSVLILGGGGKSGLLCSYVARRNSAKRIICFDYSEAGLTRARRLGCYDEYIQGDARDAIAVMKAVGERVDLTLSCVNVPGAELSAILATRPEGMVYFFSMATSFTAAALGAEGVGSPVDMLIGNGYYPGHAEVTLQLLRENPTLRAMFEELYVAGH
ncbi:MAG TPA: L-erythro-3,5-diaminohexanoate dehydrogenase [Symbiobacteriaceae bacterium]|nr:L-erythro-3,5-diaminohexanoate dehydrogenase [Symbiobacteriaceae bacterium]